MKTIFSVVLATAIGSLASLVASGVTFQEKTRNMSPEEKAEYAERIKSHRLRKTGGFITDTRSMKGSVVFLNAQSRIPLSAFSDIPDRLAKLLRRSWQTAIDWLRNKPCSPSCSADSCPVSQKDGCPLPM